MSGISAGVSDVLKKPVIPIYFPDWNGEIMTLSKSIEELREWAKNQRQSPDTIWQMTYNAIEDPVFLLTHEGEILLANEASAKLLGMSVEEILDSHHCYEIVHKTTAFIEGCPFVKAMDSKKRESYKLKMDEKWYLVAVDPINDENGNVIGAIHIITDIDDLIKTTARKAHLGEIIENTLDAIFSATGNGKIDFWNKSAAALFGYTEEEILGEDIGILMPENRKDEYKKVFEEIVSGIALERYETIILKKDGTKMEVLMNAQPVYDERKIIKGASFMLHDLTPQRKTERELLAYVTESALRLKKPVEIIKNNLDDISRLLEKGDIGIEETKLLLSVQASNAEKVIENLKDLNTAVVEKQKGIPNIYMEFLSK
ncbi:PAS domain S-box protein [Methanoplanus sp. FWC-SCC4]|uniref:histidine kinase n=1 Tax=Methanochimaera problematica TaxID=2609417 RepID=A0AA97FE50_9EURY|nr:PAS domain S-box protein [Methanoplanus sp. FWC-SCC4]WOF16877.1 PAS domain S-box protein [Methanoplanus sp. FWC-SCC4]